MKNTNKKYKRSKLKYTRKKKHLRGSRNARGLFYKTRKSSYSPSINNELVTLKSTSRDSLSNCNTLTAFKNNAQLEIGINDDKYGLRCFNYNTSEAKKFMLHSLSANKHVDPDIIIPPKQLKANCWFNAMFVNFFVSDKGRKFFHFFRQLMIEGKQKNGHVFPENIRNAFALLNFGVDACLTGNNFAYELDTNHIIHQLFKSIPDSYKKTHRYLVDENSAGNPLLYYISIINYLNNNSILLLFVRDCTIDWKERIMNMVENEDKLPHTIVLEIYNKNAKVFANKPNSFNIGNAKYEIDSAVIRDSTDQHFCSAITCEGEQMGYDGMSYHRIVPLAWKDKLNADFNWQFEGSNDADNTPLTWNFTKNYQLLVYYRVA